MSNKDNTSNGIPSATIKNGGFESNIFSTPSASKELIQTVSRQDYTPITEEEHAKNVIKARDKKSLVNRKSQTQVQVNAKKPSLNSGK